MSLTGRSIGLLGMALAGLAMERPAARKAIQTEIKAVDYSKTEARLAAHYTEQKTVKPRHAGKREAARRLRQMEKRK